MPSFAAFFKRLVFAGLGNPSTGSRGQDEAKRKKKLKFLMGSSRHFRRHPVSYILLHFKKSRFSEASGTLRQVQGGQVRPKRQNKLKFLTGYSRHFRRHPVCYILLRFKKVIFQRCRGPRDPSRGGPWQPGEAKTGEKIKILDVFSSCLH